MKRKLWQFPFIAVSFFSYVATSQAHDEAVGLAVAKWGMTTIPVCWENPVAANLTQRGWVKAAVERTWEAYSSLEFTGWGECENNSSGIRIQIQDRGAHVKALGQLLNGMENGMVLNFDFENWSPSCQLKRQFCIEVVAVHEFGHAIGFAHEQNRADAPPECQAERQGTSGDTFLTPYDANSVMNYCNPNWGGDGQLSPMDIMGVQTWYPIDGNYIIRSTYGCPGGTWCNAELSWDGGGSHPMASVEFGDRVEWKLEPVSGKPNHYIIHSTYGCPGGTWCNAELSWDGGGSHPMASVEFGDRVEWEIIRP